MKRFLLAAVALSALTSAAALAADLPARQMYTKAPAMAGYNWTGAYIGLNIGGAFGDFSSPVTGSNSMSGVTGGAQIGYNWQAPGTPWVWGVEADFNGSSQSRSDNVVGANISEKEPFFGTVRGKLGYAWNRAMVYGTGGFAYQNLKVDAITPAGAVIGSSNQTKGGYAVGGGVEWALWDRWTAKVEYLYLNTDSIGLVVPGGNVSGRLTNNVIRTGLNYHF